MKTFSDYLLEKGEAFNTINTRVQTIKRFNEWLASEETTLKKTNYTTLLNYLAFCQANGNKPRTVQLKLKSLSHYFDFLITEHKVKENPVKRVQLQGLAKTLPQKLLSETERMEIFNAQTTFGMIQKRDKVLLSLVVFQAVASKELALIEVKDVNLNQGTIYIPAMRTSNGRTLELKAQQLLLFQNYLLNVRPEILAKTGKTSDYFLVNAGNGTGVLTNVISRLLKQIKTSYPKLRDLQQIRQSVVTDWIKVYGSRKAQYMAGHRFVSSTERYNVDQLEELKKAVKSSFPLC